MSSRVKRYLGLSDLARFAVFDGVERDVTQPHSHDRRGCTRRQIMRMSRSGMVGMAVGDQCPLYGFPRIDIEIPGGAINPAIRKCKNIGHTPSLAHHLRMARALAEGRDPWCVADQDGGAMVLRFKHYACGIAGSRFQDSIIQLIGFCIRTRFPCQRRTRPLPARMDASRHRGALIFPLSAPFSLT